MNKKEDNLKEIVRLDRMRKLERRIKELQRMVTKERELFLEKDMKARGMK